MKTKLFLPLLCILACASETKPVESTTTTGESTSFVGNSESSDSGSESSSGGVAPGQSIDELTTVPDSQATSFSTMCCPIMEGTQRDALCWPDTDGIPNCQNDPDFPTGGSISGWSLVQCASCETGDDPDSTYVLNGMWGYECQGMAYNSDGFVDSDCNDVNNTNVDGGLGSCEDDSVPGNGCPTNPNVLQTGIHDGGAALMCCDIDAGTGDLDICVPKGPSDTCPGAYPTAAWSTHWQLSYDNGTATTGTAAQQWKEAVDCNTAAFNPPGTLTSCRYVMYTAPAGTVYNAANGDPM